MAFAYFGADGAYLDPSSAQYAANYSNIVTSCTSGMSGMYAAGTLGSILGGNVAGLGMSTATAQQQGYTSTESLTQYMQSVSAPAKRAVKGILAKLRSEIDGWHGDILERCPA